MGNGAFRSSTHPTSRHNDARVDVLWGVGLLLGAILLFGVDLGGLPLRDWDEGTVAQVAREIWRSPPGSLTWLYPTLDGVPYLNKPPLVHGFIALAYRFGGVNEAMSRLPGAMLSAASVPFVYAVARELFPRRTPAILAASVYLNLLPVVRHGRLAMLDGAVLCFFCLLVWCALRSRRDVRYSLGMGIGFGLLCLTKGLLAVLLGAIVLVFLAWDTPRLLTSVYLWLGVLLGSVPAWVWYAAQWQHYGTAFIETHLIQQSARRVWTSVEANAGPPWYYLLELLKYPWPWLLFWGLSWQWIWQNRNLGAAKLILTWTGLYLAAISVMGTKLPWYVLPIYPAFALAVGWWLGEVWREEDWTGMPREKAKPYPQVWRVGMGVLAVAAWGAVVGVGWGTTPIDGRLVAALAVFALTLTMTAGLLWRRDGQFVLVLVWGTYLSLLLFVTSESWIWELNEAYPVKPVAEMIRTKTPPNQPIYTSYPYNRPSLNFYSDRQILPANFPQLQQHWQDDQPYLLVEIATLEQLQLEGVRVLGSAEGWELVTKEQ
ncbi:MAG TPA: glycosyltransferase family 39 protein [Oscillatoriales cyanobacterium M59_W2019_021]|nr:glycosyltransferase family 39 protein [Oscillatoriales cyanobacterium M4454_W2019_049]HIK51689.1 glycosyltransferase family 39 protein [Oscillatoriales cyanobacterium M59_W2019_021]